jgi:hypothetical protein
VSSYHGTMDVQQERLNVYFNEVIYQNNHICGQGD